MEEIDSAENKMNKRKGFDSGRGKINKEKCKMRAKRNKENIVCSAEKKGSWRMRSPDMGGCNH